MNRTKSATVLLILFILPCILFVSGCGTTGNKVVPKSFDFNNAVLNYETGDEFSVDGLELIITYSDNSTERISITADMIKQMPDMSTPGEKTVIIIYKGSEYSFKINVVQNPNVPEQEMLARLQAFLSDYESSGKVTNINGAAIVNLVAQFLGDEESLDEVLYEFNMNPESGTLENVLYNKIYEIIRDAIINNSFDIDISQILNATGLQAKLDYLKALQDILAGFEGTDYKALFTAFATSEENIQYISLLTDKICGIFKITSDDGKAEIQDILLTLAEDPQLVSFVTDFNLAIQTYSELDENYKTIIDKAAQAALSDPDHCLSVFFLSMTDFVSITDAEENYVTTQEAEDLKAAYMANFADIIREFENIMLAEDPDAEYLSNAINNVITYCGNISEMEMILETNDWNFNGPVLPVPGELKYFLSIARAFLIKDDVIDIFINDVILCQDNIDSYLPYLTSWLCDFFKISEEGREAVDSILISFIAEIKNFETIDSGSYITQLNDAIQTYSELDENYKTIIDKAAQAALSDPDHCLSVFFLSMTDFVSITDAEENYVTTQEAEDLKAAYMANFADIIREFENIMLAEDPDAEYLSNAINNVITYCGNISEMEMILETNDWNFNGPVLPVPAGEIINYLTVADKILNNKIIEAAQCLGIIENFLKDFMFDHYQNHYTFLSMDFDKFYESFDEFYGGQEFERIVIPAGNMDTCLTFSLNHNAQIFYAIKCEQEYSGEDLYGFITYSYNVRDITFEGNYLYITPWNNSNCGIGIESNFEQDLVLYVEAVYYYDSLDDYVSPEMTWQIVIDAQYLSGDNYHHEAGAQMTNSDDFTVTDGYEQFIIPAGDVKCISLTLTMNKVWDSDYFVMFADGYSAQELLNIFSDFNYVVGYRCEGGYLYIYPENYYCTFLINMCLESDLMLNIQAVYDLDYLTQSMKCDLDVYADYKLPVITLDTVSSYIYTLLKGEEITEDLIQDLRETLIIENILEKINLNHNDYSYILPATDSYTFYLNGEFNRITVPAGNVEFKINLWANINSDCNYYYIIKSEGYSAEDLLEMIYKDYNVAQYNPHESYLYIITDSCYYNSEIYFKCNLISDLVLDVQAVYDTEFLCDNNNWSVYATATYEPYSYVYSNLKNLPMTVPAKDAFQEITVPAGNVHINLDLQLDQVVRKFYFVIRSEGYSAQDLLSFIYDDYNIKEYVCQGENLYIVPEAYYNRCQVYMQHDFTSDFVICIEAVYDSDFVRFYLNLDLDYKLNPDYVNSISSYLYDILKDGEADNTEILRVMQDLNLIESFFENFITNNYREEKNLAVTNSENFTLSEGFTEILIPSGNNDINLGFYLNMDCYDCYYVIYAEGYSAQELLGMVSGFSGVKEIIAEGEYLYIYSINDYYSNVNIGISHNFTSDLRLYIQVVCDKSYYSGYNSGDLFCYQAVNVYSRLPEELINLVSGYVYNLIEGEEILISDVIESLRDMNFIEEILLNITTKCGSDYYYQPMTISDNFIETEGYTKVDISSGNAKVILHFDKYAYTENDYVVMYVEGYSSLEILDMIILANNIKSYSCSGQYLYFTPASSSFEIVLENNFERDVVFNIQNVYGGSVSGNVPDWVLMVYSEYRLSEDVVNMLSPRIYDALSLLYNGDSFETYIKGVIDEYFTDIEAQITNALSQAMKFDYGSAAYNDLSDIVETALTGYIEGTFDLPQITEDVAAFVETYCDEKAKTFVYSLSALYIVTTQPDVDYNEVFSFIELPEGIESIDYNVLIESLISEQTYDVFTISDVVIQYIEDEEGNITGEKLTLSLSVDFDIMVTSLKGGVELSLEFAF